MIASLARIFWIFDTKLYKMPIVWIELTISVIVNVYLVYLCTKLKDALYNEYKGVFKALHIMVACAVLAFFFNPGSPRGGWFSLQILVAFSMFIEAAGLIP